MHYNIIVYNVLKSIYFRGGGAYKMYTVKYTQDRYRHGSDSPI